MKTDQATCASASNEVCEVGKGQVRIVNSICKCAVVTEDRWVKDRGKDDNRNRESKTVLNDN